MRFNTWERTESSHWNEETTSERKSNYLSHVKSVIVIPVRTFAEILKRYQNALRIRIAHMSAIIYRVIISL